MPTEYTTPVKNLLTYGDCSAADPRAEWPNYLELGLTREHIPELIQMATDPELHAAPGESLEVWAPVHAWRTLAQLQAEEAVEPLVMLSAENSDDDWLSNELPTVFQRIGPKAIPGLTRSLYAFAEDVSTCIGITESLQLIGNNYPASRTDCVSVLTEFLAKFREHDPELNAWMIDALTELHAVEALPVIREAFAQEYVDYSVLGDLEDVEIELGLRATRATPPAHPTPGDRVPGLLESLDAFMGRPAKQEKPEKIGRNDPCPCGSGKKYKKCCLNNPDGPLREEFLAMFSKQKIQIPQRKKDELLELLRKKKRDAAIQLVKTCTTAETRFIEDYVTHLEAQALSRPKKSWEE